MKTFLDGLELVLEAVLYKFVSPTELLAEAATLEVTTLGDAEDDEVVLLAPIEMPVLNEMLEPRTEGPFSEFGWLAPVVANGTVPLSVLIR